VDESPVPEIERFEIYADRTQVIKQRYPAAGSPNASVQLFVVEIAPDPVPRAAAALAPPVQIDLGPDPDFYLARVSWFPDSNALAVQREDRDQKTLTLLRADPVAGATTPLLQEHSNAWIELNDNLALLGQSHQFVWASSRSGYQHLYLYDWDGKLIRPLTEGDWQVTGDNDSHGVRGVDEKRGLVYFIANKESPLERHLYSVSFTDPSVPMQKINSDSGWHAVAMSGDAQMFLDTFSTPDQPPSLTLRSVTGESLADLAPNRITHDHPYAPYLA